MDKQLQAQGLSLLWTIFYHALMAAIRVPYYLIRNLLFRPEQPPQGQESVIFYEGTVSHTRRQPKVNNFRYPVRCAVVSLDQPPAWFTAEQAKDHMTADEARAYAGTKGPVKLLTNPISAGYVMNPISVYYCYTPDGSTVDKCIAEVTNTPWNERVTFVFLPGSTDKIKKSLHVSPLMDMRGTWTLEAPQPGATMKLVVRVTHPEYGAFFYADIVGIRCNGPAASARNEYAGLRALLRYGLQPHRIAVWIYWQAAVLLWKGVPLYSPPPKSVLEEAVVGATHPVNAITACPFTWRPAPIPWPWGTWANTAPDSGSAPGSKPSKAL